MSEKNMILAGRIAAGLYEYMFSHNGPHEIDGETYDIATDEQYQALGEDITAPDLPLILVRRSDGQFVEMDIDVSVQDTSAESRRQHLERLSKMRDRAEARKGKTA